MDFVVPIRRCRSAERGSISLIESAFTMLLVGVVFYTAIESFSVSTGKRVTQDYCVIQSDDPLDPNWSDPENGGCAIPVPVAPE